MTSVKEFASSLQEETKWHGDHHENSKQVVCKAGSLTMIYERGNLRHISIGGIELVRMIYSAVRVREWITVYPVISNEKIEIEPDSFKISYSASYLTEEINFQAEYSISGYSDNSLTFSLEGEALNDFEKNRIGFCVLHPIEGNRGESCTIIHSNGTAEDLSFPFVISPRQPFLDIKSMRWRRQGISCELDFFGDVFETEDQRNWTDASYKTYCTPLSNPRPALIKKGQKTSQKIVFKTAAEAPVKAVDPDVITITIDRNKSFPLPVIGIGQSTRHDPLTAGEIELIKRIEFDHYRSDVYLFNEDWNIKAEKAFTESALLGYKTELALFVDDDFKDQVIKLIAWINSVPHNLAVIILYHKTAPVIPDVLVEHIIPILKEALPGVKICCGTNANFVQLNRNRPLSSLCDCISYSIHPQEHASDNLTLIENLQAQAYTVESALRFSGNRKIRISPLNIQRRFNANNSNFEKLSNGTNVPPQVDSRLMSLFGGCWIAGSLKYLTESGAGGITLLETVGERGIVQGDYNSRWPEDFHSVKGMIFPVYSILKYILRNKKLTVTGSNSSGPLKVDSLILGNEETVKIILWNFTSEIQKVHFEPRLNLAAKCALNSRTYALAASDEEWLEKAEAAEIIDSEQLLLDPFSVTFVEG
jgi:D-apionolactonase